ncbi:MAG: DUF1501 domain-containing protein, partial [Acidobacteriota bacterium]|nr:DUF1501 domain-containing protein [Acidobacteriota bacterium]
MNPYSCNRRAAASSRREFLTRSGLGFGGLALNCMLQSESARADVPTAAAYNPLGVKPPHFTAKARSVIFIFLQGGPSQLETFDPKPELQKYDGQYLPPSYLTKGIGLAQIKAD